MQLIAEQKIDGEVYALTGKTMLSIFEIVAPRKVVVPREILLLKNEWSMRFDD